MLYFCSSGVSGFVTDNNKFDSVVYLTIEEGDFLGLVDFVPTEEEIKIGR